MGDVTGEDQGPDEQQDQQGQDSAAA